MSQPAQITQITQAEGNTKTSAKRYRKYIITINNPTAKIITQTTQLFRQGDGVYQIEKGENGTPHIQGCISLKNAKTFDAIKKIIPTAHIEICHDWDASVAYCQKEETRIEEPKYFGKIKKIEIIKDPMIGKTWKNWQIDIVNMIKTEPDERKIYWYWEKNGGVGKSCLAKHLILKHNCMIVGGKGTDIRHGITTWIEEYGKLETIIIDCCRSMERFISYEAIEQAKNGVFFSGKYESKQCVFNTPHIICFANFEPMYENLSEDRWIIVNIEQEGSAPCTPDIRT